MNEPDDGAWFAAKTFGYGAGLPIAWQGWALLGVMFGCGVALWWTLLPAHPGLFSAGTIAVAIVPLPLIKARTRGGWRWRNGQGSDQSSK
jgi:hypothetical protein